MVIIKEDRIPIKNKFITIVYNRGDEKFSAQPSIS